MQDVIIIGGGLAGLVSALELRRAGFGVTLVERKTYPFHKVCGEYVSNEVRPYIESLGIDLDDLDAARISEFWLSAPSGKLLKSPLDLGGFGISRYVLDYQLYQLGMAADVDFRLSQTVDNVTFTNDSFLVELASGEQLTARLVLGTFGKRTKLDKTLDRAFMAQPSPYMGVKYHVAGINFPTDVIALHNFPDGYCGMSAIEDNKFCFCYLTTRANVREHGSIEAMEKALMYQNLHLRAVFETGTFLYDRPEVINEVSFAPKRAVEDHILMAGDAAGLITPLCGNGMAMAIHGAKLASGLAIRFLHNELTRPDLERTYQAGWSALFGRRLWVGRTVQNLFGQSWLSELAIAAFGTVRPALHTVMKQTHGEVITV